MSTLLTIMLDFDLIGYIISSLLSVISFGVNQRIEVHKYVVEFPFQNRTSELHTMTDWNTGSIIPLILAMSIFLVMPALYFVMSTDRNMEDTTPKPYYGIANGVRLLSVISFVVLMVMTTQNMSSTDDQTLAQYTIPVLWNCTAPWYVYCTYTVAGTTLTIKIPPEGETLRQTHNSLQIWISITFGISCLFVMVFVWMRYKVRKEKATTNRSITSLV